MTFISAAHLKHLDSFPKKADDGGKLLKLDTSLPLDEQLVFVMKAFCHVGLFEYQKDLLGRLVDQGADPFALKLSPDAASIPWYEATPPAFKGTWQGFHSAPVKISKLGNAISNGNRHFIGTFLSRWKNTQALPDVLELADGTKVSALELAAVAGKENVVNDILHRFPAGTLGPTRAAILEHAAKAAYESQERNQVTPAATSTLPSIIMALVAAGASLDAPYWNAKNFKSGNGKVGIVPAMLQTMGDVQSSTQYSINGGAALTWEQEMERRAALLAPKLADCASRGLDIVGDTKKRGTSVLHLAARYNMTACIPVLLEAGANVNAKDNKGHTPATQPGVLPGVRQMLDSWAAQEAVKKTLAKASKSQKHTP